MPGMLVVRLHVAAACGRSQALEGMSTQDSREQCKQGKQGQQGKQGRGIRDLGREAKEAATRTKMQKKNEGPGEE